MHIGEILENNMAEKRKTITEIIMEFFKAHPNEPLPHGPVVDYVESVYVAQTGRKPRDPWREIRRLYQSGKLICVETGVYMYDPDYVNNVELFDFDPVTKQQIFERDDYRCVICGRGPQDGVKIAADHKMPKDRGGDNSLENGQTLCYEHNNLKSNYSATETGKRYLIRLYEKAVTIDDQRMIDFCEDIFDVFDKHGVDTHIDRPRKKLF